MDVLTGFLKRLRSWRPHGKDRHSRGGMQAILGMVTITVLVLSLLIPSPTSAAETGGRVKKSQLPRQAVSSTSQDRPKAGADSSRASRRAAALKARARMQQEAGPAYVPGEIIVKFKRGVRPADIDALQRKYGFKVKRQFFTGAQVWRLKNRSHTEKVLKELRASGQFEYVQPNYRSRPVKWWKSRVPSGLG